MKNIIPKQYRKNYKGCFKNPFDPRDIVLGDIPYISDPNAPSWEEGFDNEQKYGKLKREHQGSSLSCVGQAWSKYLEMLNLIEEKKFVDLSARDIYSQIYLHNGGAYIRDGAIKCVRNGDAKEKFVPSYKDGKPPTEEFMRKKPEITPEYITSRARYKAKSFVYLDTHWPLRSEDWEHMRQVIWQFGGFVSGYQHHAMYFSAYKLINGKRAIRGVNSYGEGSDRWYIENDTHELFDITFLYDLPNPPDKIHMLKLIGNKNNKRVYIIINGKRLWVKDPSMFNDGFVEKIHGDWNNIQWIDTKEVTKYPLIKMTFAQFVTHYFDN